MQIEQFRQRLRALGAKPEHEQRMLRDWLQLRPRDAGRRPANDYLPLSVRAALPAIDDELHGIASLVSTHPADNGSARLLVSLADGQMVESVLLPRDGLCISSQIGCAVGCGFCMTGRSGLIRQLTSGEMLAQVVLARSLARVKKIVFMGMGEPAHNLDNVLEAIDVLGTEGDIGHKNLVLSTVGDMRVFERLPQQRVKPALAISLHTTKNALRRQLLPRAPDLSPAELVKMAEAYSRLTNYPIQYQWTLLEGVNDGDDEVSGIIELLRGKYAVMNLIPYNAVPDLPYRRPAWERAKTMVRMLHDNGIAASLRDSAAQEVDGGCGQLRARAMVPPRRQIVLQPA